MHIPMAYDVVPPTDPQQSRYVGSGSDDARLDAYAVSAIAQGGDGPGQSLLLSSQEQVWQAELAAEGAAHLPVSWYRHTPKQCLTSPYGVINQVISGLANFGLNVGLGYGILKNNDVVGLWKEPDHGEDPYNMSAIGDLLITTFAIAFFTCLISTPGIRGALKKGQVIPVEGKLLRGGCLTFTPVRFMGTCTRSLFISLWAVVVFGLSTVLLLGIVCGAGGFQESGSQCSFSKTGFIWFKGVFAFFVALTVYPLVLLSAVNTRTMPQLDLSIFLDLQKQKWEAEQMKKNPAPL